MKHDFALARERGVGDGMSDIEVFFNRPGKSIPIDRLCAEILAAKAFIGMACAWFTDDQIADAIVTSGAPRKLVGLSAADLYRNKRVASATQHLLDHETGERGRDWKGLRVMILGSGDFKEGLLHHKFIIIDDAMVWTGSYNFTYQARRNYEALIRISDPVVVKAFTEELMDLRYEEDLWSSDSDASGMGNYAFRCGECGKIRPYRDGDDTHSQPRICADCMK